MTEKCKICGHKRHSGKCWYISNWWIAVTVIVVFAVIATFVFIAISIVSTIAVVAVAVAVAGGFSFTAAAVVVTFAEWIKVNKSCRCMGEKEASV